MDYNYHKKIDHYNFHLVFTRYLVDPCVKTKKCCLFRKASNYKDNTVNVDPEPKYGYYFVILPLGFPFFREEVVRRVFVKDTRTM